MTLLFRFHVTDRRRYPRYVFLTPIGGRARTVLDCQIEARNADEAVVVTSHAAAKGERFVMETNFPAGEPTSSLVRVLSSTPDVGSGATRFRLQLKVSPQSNGSHREGRRLDDE